MYQDVLSQYFAVAIVVIIGLAFIGWANGRENNFKISIERMCQTEYYWIGQDISISPSLAKLKEKNIEDRIIALSQKFRKAKNSTNYCCVLAQLLEAKEIELKKKSLQLNLFSV